MTDKGLIKELFSRTGVNFLIKRSSRKTLAVYFTMGKAPEIRCNYNFPDKIIIDFILKNNNKIMRKLHKTEVTDAKFKPEIGGKVMFLGEEYDIMSGNGCKFDREKKIFYVPKDGNASNIKTFFEQKCREKLKDIVLSDRLPYFSEIMGLRPVKASIGRAKTSWGVCGGQNVRFSFYLAIADMKTIDYVIVHELAHLRHKNHGKGFWNEVETFFPDYKVSRAKLKTYSKAIF